MANKNTDTYKSKDDKNIEKRADIRYKDQVQYLLDLIPESPVFKQDLTTNVEGVVFPAFKWTVNNEYTIDSEFRRVFSIESDDVEVSLFQLKPRDYKNVIRACEQRRAALLQQYKKQK